jgi:hypothetical protein
VRRGAPLFLAALLGAASMMLATTASAQQPAKPPPGTGTDMEIDPDAPPPPEEPKPEEPPLPPADPDAWGVGGKDEEGRFAPKGKTGSLKEEEEDKKDEDDNKGPVDLGPPGAASIEMVVGFGEINEVLNDATIPTEATIFSFIFGVQYRFFDIWTIGLRLPYSTGSLKGPLPSDTDDYNTFALGNLELSVRPSFQVTRRLRIPAGIALMIPMASGDLFADPSVDAGSVAQALINQAADASRGLEESALFASKRFGLVPSVGVTYDRGALRITAQTKLEMMFKTGGNDPDPKIQASHEGAELHNPNTNWVTGASIFYGFLDGKVSPGLRTWLAVSTQPITKGTRDFSGPQFAIEPAVIGKFPITPAIAIKAGLSYILPIAGPVGGRDNSASMGGLRMQVGVLF